MFNYITIDDEGAIVGISTLNSEVRDKNMFLVPYVETSMLLKHYDTETGVIE